MFRFTDDIDDLEFLPENDFFAFRIKASCTVYGQTPGFYCWVSEKQAAVCAMDGHACLFAVEGADHTEISAFLRFMAFDSVLTSADTASRLSVKPIRTGSVMIYEGLKCDSKSFSSAPSNKGDFYDLYSLLGIGSGFDEWFAGLAFQINHGFADVRGIKIKGMAAATSSKLFIVNGHSLLSAVYVKNEYRGKGLAKAMVNELSDNGTFLLCDHDLTGFYGKLGYKALDNWTEVII